MVARLPMQGSDVGNWGQVLNEFLYIEHNTDGTLKLAETILGKYDKPLAGIPKSHFAESVRASLTKADNSSTTLTGLHDVTVARAPTAGQVLTYDDTTGTWVNGNIPTPLLTKNDIPTITKDDVGLNNVTNEAQLPLTGGTLSGSLRVNDGSTLRAYHTDNLKYIEVKADDYWSYVSAQGTPGLLLSGATVQITATTQGVLNTPLVTASGRMVVNGAVDQANGLDVAGNIGITRALADTSAPAISMYKRGTTGDATAAVKSGNTMFALQGFGYYGAGYSQQATVAINATQDWTAASRGTSMSFMVTPNGSTARSIALSIGQNSQLTVNGDLSLANGKNIIINTTTGSMIGTTATQKIGFYGAAPVVRPTAVGVDAPSIHAALVKLGLITA
jgi:hypothetical protein